MADNDVPSLYPGAVLTGRRRYVIERVLGAGGFGITYCASTDITVDNITVTARMAVKEHFVSLYNERADNNVTVTTPGSQKVRELVANSMRDFLGEARRLQQLGAGHPNIVKVNEVFEANGTAYYVMEYLDGSSLWDNIKDRGMTEPDMLALMLPIVDAVAYLHRNRLTHLDIKPQNIMLAAGEGGAVRPVLIDFGLSKHYDAEGHATSTINTLACSDGYSPAEQYSGIMTFTPSADVYALGATMIACLTGKTPPKSTEWTAGERMRYIDTLPVSEPLRAALRGALADTSQRLPDASALANIMTDSATRNIGGEISLQAKRSAITNLPTSGMVSSNATRPVERRYSTAGSTRFSTVGQSTRLSIILIALAALAIGAGAYFAFRGGNNPQPPVPVIDTLAIAQTLETDPVAVDNSAAEAAAAAEAERQRLAEQERQR
ncbi:MAG: serine/threonine protein kinase, partial [Muribaculaceae bacterium]|nr:serine/threonine protein kinase [Muribaculaceae bacterium]